MVTVLFEVLPGSLGWQVIVHEPGFSHLLLEERDGKFCDFFDTEEAAIAAVDEEKRAQRKGEAR